MNSAASSYLWIVTKFETPSRSLRFFAKIELSKEVNVEYTVRARYFMKVRSTEAASDVPMLDRKYLRCLAVLGALAGVAYTLSQRTPSQNALSEKGLPSPAIPFRLSQSRTSHVLA